METRRARICELHLSIAISVFPEWDGQRRCRKKWCKGRNLHGRVIVSRRALAGREPRDGVFGMGLPMTRSAGGLANISMRSRVGYCFGGRCNMSTGVAAHDA